AIRVENANPHSAAMFLLKKPAAEPAFVGSDANIYMGINLFSSAYENGKLTITRPAEGFENAKIYALYPQGYEPTGKVVWQESGYTLTENT
ncbi:MAG: hypothetical protein IKU90_08085, partial [Clostridia bacterium]|nr:hypothetical protein [Clostridia bacterium]